MSPELVAVDSPQSGSTDIYSLVTCIFLFTSNVLRTVTEKKFSRLLKSLKQQYQTALEENIPTTKLKNISTWKNVLRQLKIKLIESV